MTPTEPAPVAARHSWATPREAVALVLQGITLPTAGKTALFVGSLLSMVNQAGVIAAGDATPATGVRILVNYLTPFIVASIGYLAPLRQSKRPREAGTEPLPADREPSSWLDAPASTALAEVPLRPEPAIQPTARESASAGADLVSMTEARERLERLTERAVANLDRARSASDESGRASQLVGESLSDIEGMLKAVSETIEAGRHINDVLTTVTGVSEKTNLLALNATIEAARAGDAGRGFAVVADEVKKLSQLSAGSAEESHQVITRILNHLSDVHEASSAIEDRFAHLTERLVAIDELTAAIVDAAGAQPAAVESILASLGLAVESPTAELWCSEDAGPRPLAAQGAL